MHIKELPVLILAAGMSRRFNEEDRKIPKSLLKIDAEHTIFDIILKGLQQNGIPQVNIVLGYKADKFTKYLQEKVPSPTSVKVIYAEESYVKGPLFTLLSFLPHITQKMNEIIVIPSDTIFHPTILQQIMSTDIGQSTSYCYIFTLKLSVDQIFTFNKQITFSPQIIDISSKLSVLIAQKPGLKQHVCIVPILILSKSFLDYLRKPENYVSNKLLPNLEKYFEITGLCKIKPLVYDDIITPFIDIDTSTVYHSLHSSKKEIFQAYKYK